MGIVTFFGSSFFSNVKRKRGKMKEVREIQS